MEPSTSFRSTPAAANPDEPPVYSPFWAVWAVFATLVVIQVVYLVNDFSERAQVIASKQETEKLMPQVAQINQATEMMGRGLLDLANAGSLEARKIATEMQIKVNPVAGASQR